MNTIHTSLRLTTIDRWLAPHVAALISFAETDHVFAMTLATLIQDEQWISFDSPIIASSAYHLPTDYEKAEDILDWLIYELITHPEARVSRSLLVTWAHSYQAPENIVIGIEGIALLGPTLGLINKKKTKSQLQIVVDSAWFTALAATSAVEATHTLSQEVLSAELRKAGGKISSLHPDTAEWCMGGARTKLYESDNATLTQLHTTAVNENLHHQIITKEEQVVAIAISPSVDDALVEELIPNTDTE